ncbi:hypothetical protein SARC_10375 [Sphaeroforma arctica JP610]|uniref:Uncharacterized protein n=1 Tax=Sphaeroforma arctica JP610 TaxID=667725 RepID=A0A0L0FM98_9EUKA|nr:hypothetical protein SARC_10375 [Sphaeroforma arctica JP610]KNC77158.1 hypothetical protein SARC_10375 [Sphaeroforma arctica JP610]|eukprot:XP_014151060.1 hypothetical protein SARC_10375 [Sphaeroforma arctica JP610]
MRVVSELILVACALSMAVTASPARRQIISESMMMSEESAGLTDEVSAAVAEETRDLMAESGIIEAEEEIVCLPDDTCPVGYSKISNAADLLSIPPVGPFEEQPDEDGIPLPANPSAPDAIACQQGNISCPSSMLEIEGLSTCCPTGFYIGNIEATGPTVFGRRSVSRRSTCECLPGTQPVRRQTLDDVAPIFNDVDVLFSETAEMATSLPVVPEDLNTCMCKRDREDVDESAESAPTGEMSGAIESGAEGGMMPCLVNDDCADSNAMGDEMGCCPDEFEMVEPMFSDEECMCAPLAI